ncbi:TPM domain-containing protein [Leifsonia shinshuensis]|uniref:TPM domain-containing protein n=1 Tax=Leifsonia shinshuensis TaxID=150026 RepID=A0A7G6Y8M6_9MICO|nr:TPM domain-containing protein [Leifsonia shinshuensis]QNE34841.1 TPM domain-containing protein [Leifsonia shinshuensis]
MSVHRSLTGRRALIALLLAAGVVAAPLVLSPPAAHAARVDQTARTQDPVDFGSGHVVDQASVLSDADVDTIEAASASLHKNHGIRLYVAYVDHFTNPTDAEDWANETAARNDLGPTDYLLAVATDGQAYYLSGDSSGPVSDQELTSIEQTQVEPKLRTQDWTPAAVAAAQGLGAAVGDSGGAVIFWVVLVVVLVVGAVVLYLVFRRRRAKRDVEQREGAS